MEEESKLKKIIIKSAYVLIIVLIISVVLLLIFKYNVEGEKNMPFKLSSIMIISNAEGFQIEENEEYRWDAEIYQNNDIYLNIEKNKNYKEVDSIKSVIIDNLKVTNYPEIGQISFYRPSNDDTKLFNYNEEYEIKNNVEYTGDINSDLKNLRISNQGNTIMIRAVNDLKKRYLSNDDYMEHNGKLLNKVSVNYEQVKAKISFDLIIKLESETAFKANIELELPVGDITKEGSSNLEISNMKNIIFKREQI